MAKKKVPTKLKKMEPIDVLPEEYGGILEEVKKKIKNSQLEALKAVNRELVAMYWFIGKIINDQQQRHSWGTSIVEQFAKDLQITFPGMKGLSSRNMWKMRDLYASYSGNTKLTALLSEISWTHHTYILEKCKNPLEREFYIRMASKNRWSSRVLLHQIEGDAYERTMLGQTNFDKNLPEKMRPDAKLAVKDEYAFSFLDLGDDFDERDLERALVGNVEHFLREVGNVYSFMGSQYRLEVDGQEFLIDILLFHRKLKSLVAIELKVGSFKPEYVGKMQFYLSVLNNTVRLEGENQAIGIILCKEKSRTVVEYSLNDATQAIGVATYRMFRDLPKELRAELPTPEQVEILLEHITKK